MDTFIQYLAVGACGVLLGSAELASRYRDSPVDLLRIPGTYFYLACNVLISWAALWLLDVLSPNSFPVAADNEARPVYEVLIAGFGGAAFFRSSIAKTKIGDVEIGVGPAFVIDVLLAVSDRLIDRKRALERSRTIPALMRDVPPDFAAQSLTEFAVALMQNLSAADERTLKTRVDASFKTDLPSPVKSILIGLILSEYIGYDALRDAKDKLQPELEEARSASQSLNVSDLQRMIEEGNAAGDEDDVVPGQAPENEIRS